MTTAAAFLLFANAPATAADVSVLLLDTFMKTCGSLPSTIAELDELAGGLGFQTDFASHSPRESNRPFDIQTWKIGNYSISPIISIVVNNSSGHRGCILKMPGESPLAVELMNKKLNVGSPTEEHAAEFENGALWDISEAGHKVLYDWTQSTVGNRTISAMTVDY